MSVPNIQIGPLYQTEDDYCRLVDTYAKYADTIFNYTFEDMKDPIETYKYFFNSKPYFETVGIGISSLDAGCKLGVYGQTQLTNFDLITPKDGDCNVLFTNYPKLFGKSLKFVGTFDSITKQSNIQEFITSITQNRVEKTKNIESTIVFTDGQECTIKWDQFVDGSGTLYNTDYVCNCKELPGSAVMDSAQSSMPIGTSTTEISSMTIASEGPTTQK